MRLGFFSLFGLVAIALLAVWVWSLVDALRRPPAEWERAGQSQILWVIVIVFLQVLGSALYYFIARPQLEEAGRS